MSLSTFRRTPRVVTNHYELWGKVKQLCPWILIFNGRFLCGSNSYKSCLQCCPLSPYPLADIRFSSLHQFIGQRQYSYPIKPSTSTRTRFLLEFCFLDWNANYPTVSYMSFYDGRFCCYKYSFVECTSTLLCSCHLIGCSVTYIYVSYFPLWWRIETRLIWR